MDQDLPSTVHYVTQDPLRNLRIKVTLTRISAARTQHQADVGSAASAAGQASTAAATADTATSQHPADAQPSTSGATDAPQAAAASDQPQQFTQLSRTFTWQEKVHSKAELVAAQAQLRGPDQQPGILGRLRRTARFGSQQPFTPERLLLEDPEGSVLFTYVHTDNFCDRYELGRQVTTSSSEGSNYLVRKLLKEPRNRHKVLGFKPMFIMADMGEETTVAGYSEKVLAVLKAQPDGSLDMQPGFCAAGERYRFEDDHGGVYEYTLENVSKTAAPSLEKRTAKLAAAVAARAEEMRSRHAGMTFTPPPGPDGNAVRLVVYGELLSAAGYMRDRLYLEYAITWDPEVWALQHAGGPQPVEPGVIKGVTAVSKLVPYPPDPDSPSGLPLWVAHWAHPLELEWVAKAAPPPRAWPLLLMQVCSYDTWDRYTTEGYGWCPLSTGVPGCATHLVHTWKPAGSAQDKQRAFFIGGSPELQDLRDMVAMQGPTVNRFGLSTETTGAVKVRLHCIHQAGSTSAVERDSPTKLPLNHPDSPTRRTAGRRQMSLAVVLERARARLMEARGGSVAVREGVVAEAPFLRQQPEDVECDEGATVQFEVAAGGMPPLSFQWFKDERRLNVATSNTNKLILVDVAPTESGAYYCQVSNRDGSVSSSKALLNVRRLGRMQRAAAVSRGGSPEPNTPRLQDTLGRRTIVPRTLPSQGGSPRPYSPRGFSQLQHQGSLPSGEAGSSGDTSSPLRRQLGRTGGGGLLRQGTASSEGLVGDSGGSPPRQPSPLRPAGMSRLAPLGAAPAAGGAAAAAGTPTPAAEGSAAAAEEQPGAVSGTQAADQVPQGAPAAAPAVASASVPAAAAGAAGALEQLLPASGFQQTSGPAGLEGLGASSSSTAGLTAEGGAAGAPPTAVNSQGAVLPEQSSAGSIQQQPSAADSPGQRLAGSRTSSGGMRTRVPRASGS